MAKTEEMLRAGTSRGDIFRTLGATDDVATQMASVPSFEDRTRYSRLNRIYFGILVYTSIAKAVFPIVNTTLNSLPLFTIIFPLFISAYLMYGAFEVNKFHGRFYALSGFFCIYICLSSFSAYMVHSHELESVLLMLVVNIPILFGGILGLYLKKKLCPYLGFWGAKTDRSGHYLFLRDSE